MSTRRELLRNAVLGVAGIALAGLPRIPAAAIPEKLLGKEATEGAARLKEMTECIKPAVTAINEMADALRELPRVIDSYGAELFVNGVPVRGTAMGIELIETKWPVGQAWPFDHPMCRCVPVGEVTFELVQELDDDTA